MEKTKNNLKTIWIATIVILIITFILAATGTVLMFCNYKTTTISSYNVTNYGFTGNGYYTYHDVYTDNPVAGVMPLFGTLLILSSLFTFGFSYKKNKKLSILTIIFITIGQALLYSSIVFCSSRIAYIGWYICVSAAALLTVCKILTIIYLALAVSQKGSTKAPSSIDNYFDYYNKCADALMQIKALKDDGILTEEEFNSEKQKILQKFNVTTSNINSFILDGEYISDNSNIVIKNNAYVFALDGNIIKTGDVEYDENKKIVTLKATDGSMVEFNVKGNDLLSKSGVIYTKTI